MIVCHFQIFWFGSDAIAAVFLHYLDENWKEQEMYLEDDMSELIQHEYDHLDGILATMRAIDNKSL